VTDIAGCIEADEADRCRGRDERRDGSPIRCISWTLAGCGYCGVQN
jgi:hypothetical protein